MIKDLQREYNSAVILITHDLGVVAETCERVLVMYGGQCVEMGTVDEIFYHPEMPYTWGLLGSMPRMDRTRQARLQPIAGQPPSLIQVPKGCVFNPRCRFTDHVPETLAARCARIWSRRPAVTPCGVTSTRPNANGSGRPRSRRSCDAMTEQQVATNRYATREACI